MGKIKGFEDVFKSLMCVVDASPNRVGIKDIMKHTGLSERAQQQTMKDLVTAGYVFSDGNNPSGFTVNNDKIQELFHVEQESE